MARIRNLVSDILPAPLFEAAAAVKRQLSVFVGGTRTYHQLFAEKAARLCALETSRVLVVGANTGLECKLFIEKGAREVHGLDVCEGIGADFRHERVTYHKAPIEKSGLPQDYFDLIFSVATMEHVPALEAAFAEMERMTRPGGHVMSYAAPLWQSRFGHHMECFRDHPWVHLIFERDALLDYAQSQGVEADGGNRLEDIVDYMMSPDHFNMRPAPDYLRACSQLRSMLVRSNELHMDPRGYLDHPLGQKALGLGYDKASLLAGAHLFVGKKR